MNEIIEFTDRERFLISYYRDPQLSSQSRFWVLEGLAIVVSLALIGLYLLNEDPGWGVAGYGILLWQVIRNLLHGNRYSRDFRAIFQKYDAKVRELAGPE
ncbi:MAG: hypothetical protein H7A45_00250 [Verrucomicrobiales bacterium]|nr:hypothetical protein [Verrucomicrobiales bacterium]MCP5522689.1 hypothetical protein [Verrucomicrobiales bacterium]